MNVLHMCCLLHALCAAESTYWSQNAVFNGTQTAVHSSNLSDCFVCVSGPANALQGLPLEAEPLRTEAWLTTEVVTAKTDCGETPSPYAIAVTHMASLCYASEQGMNEVGIYPHCAVTVTIRQMGLREGTITSHRTASQCNDTVNVTSWQHTPVGANLWVTDFGALSNNVTHCSVRSF